MRIVVVHSEPQVAQQWRQELRERLPSATVDVWNDSAASADESDESAEAADYGVGWMPPPAFFRAHPRLKAFLSAAAGVDHLLRSPDLPPSVPVIRLEDAGMARQMIEYCCHRVFAIYRGYDRYRAQQAQREWRELRPAPRDRFVVGVFGLGVLGRAVATAIAGFGYRVRGFSRTPRTVSGIETFAGPDGWPRFLGGSNVLIALAPLTPQTENLLDRRSLSLLPQGAHLINVARGGLVVDEDLLALLDDGHLAGATLDVFREEPLPREHRYWTHPKVTMTPHVAAFTLVDEGASLVAAQIAQLERGERPSGWVDRDRGY